MLLIGSEKENKIKFSKNNKNQRKVNNSIALNSATTNGVGRGVR